MTDGSSRQRLRPWLEAKINSQNVFGLKWINAHEKIFRIPWKHAGKSDWSESDSTIFKDWAIHTGRFREGVDEPDFPCWKTRLRCALNKLPDIEEIKDMTYLEGQEPHKVFKFLPKQVKHRGPRGSSHAATSTTVPHQVNGIKSDRNVPTTVTTFTPATNGLTTMYQNSKHPNINHRSDAPFLPEVPHVKRETSPMETDVVIETNSYPTNKVTGAPPSDNNNREGLPPPPLVVPPEHELLVKLRYRDMEVTEHKVMNPGGCRLYYGPCPSEVMPSNDSLSHEIFGPNNMDQIHFPLDQNTLRNPRQEKLTLQLLNVMDRGLLIHEDNGDIYVIRKCRCVIFVASPHYPDQLIKLSREERVKVFDFQGNFMPALENYFRKKGPMPKVEIVIGFGQKWSPPAQGYNNLLISASVIPLRAQNYIQHLPQAPEGTPFSSLQISTPNDFDRFISDMAVIGGSCE